MMSLLQTLFQKDIDMKYVMIITIVILAFITGTQVSSANSHIATAPQTERDISVNDYANKWLIPDNASRMIAYHHSLNKS
jgi:uncharacterized membrane protein